ncbi:MAG: hypothetical protein EAZ85_05570 [Bacteroidetes bacterium]|nr:MAG: hypothetical protein EAZ85_05570 [Bacteroidota bacterium]TAG89280.1 MAG: hypothetical protein EAZ20_06840 [Bacteroidota bacterium]
MHLKISFFKLFIYLFFFIFHHIIIAQEKKDESEKYYEKAIQLLEKDKNEEALENLNKAIGLNPSYYDAIFARGFFCQQTNQIEQAVKDYELLNRLYPSKIDPLIGLGQILLEDEQYEKAEEKFLLAYEIDSTDIYALNNLGVFYYVTDFYDDAMFFLDKGLKYKENDEISLFYRAKTFIAMENFEAAKKDIENLLSKNPKDNETKKLQMDFYFQQKKYDETIKIAEELRKNDVSFSLDNFLLIGKALMFQKKYKEALDYLEMPDKPQDAEIYHYRAKAKFKIKEFKDALNDIDSALVLTPKNDISRDNMLYDRAIIYHQQNKIKEAEKDYLEAIYLTPELYKVTPTQIENHILLGEANKILLLDKKQKPKIDSVLVLAYIERAELYLGEQKYPEAMLQTHEAMVLDSLNSKVFTIRGMARAMQQDYPKALKDLEKAENLSKNKDLGQIYYVKGVLYREQNDLINAKKTFEKATQQKPQIADYWAELAHSESELKDYQNALLHIEKAISLDNDEAEFYLDKSIYLYHLKNYEKSLEDCKKALELDNQNPFIYYQRALIYYEMKKYSEAADDLDIVLENFPEDEKSKQLLEECSKKITKK